MNRESDHRTNFTIEDISKDDGRGKSTHQWKIVSGDNTYYVTWLPTDAKRLRRAEILPYTCTCPDWIMRRAYLVGIEGTCKHVKRVICRNTEGGDNA